MPSDWLAFATASVDLMAASMRVPLALCWRFFPLTKRGEKLTRITRWWFEFMEHHDRSKKNAQPWPLKDSGQYRSIRPTLVLSTKKQISSKLTFILAWRTSWRASPCTSASCYFQFCWLEILLPNLACGLQPWHFIQCLIIPEVWLGVDIWWLDRYLSSNHIDTSSTACIIQIRCIEVHYN